MSRIPPWMVGVKERERERERAEKAITVYGVFKHSAGEGYVVRSGRRRDDGSFSFDMPYRDATPVVVSKQRSAAQKRADKLNGE